MYEGACIRRGTGLPEYGSPRAWLFDAGYATCLVLLAWHSRLARQLLQVFQLLLGSAQRLLLGVDLFLLFARVFGKLGMVAQHGARVAVIGRCPQPCLA